VIKARRIRWPGNMACIEEKRNSYWILIRKPNGKRLL
jgi:hypothetical protein